MNRKPLSRRDFLKIAGSGIAVAAPAVFGYNLFRSAQGEIPIPNSPYAKTTEATPLDGSVPILLLLNSNSDNPFGVYLGEILRAEGVNGYHIADVSRLESIALERYDTLILAEGPLNASQVDTLSEYVSAGGNLIGMKPDEALLKVFNVEKVAGKLSGGYIQTDPSHSAGKGITPLTLQLHDDANFYHSVDTQVVAWLYQTSETSANYPAVTTNTYGKGIAVLWAFDLAKSIVYTRQGDPSKSGQELDGHPFVRATDMFAGWVDLDRIEIPQADEQQRLLVNIVNELIARKKPLPRIWHFPGGAGAVFVATSDAHPMSDAKAIEDVLSRVEKYNGHMSVYYSFTLHDDLYRFAQRCRFIAGQLPVIGEALSARFNTIAPDDVQGWRARGHEFTVHPHVGSGTCGGFGDGGLVEFDDLDEAWQTYWKQFTGLGYGPVSPTVRTHCVLWNGWVETARVQSSYGIRMNLDFYHVGPSLQKKNGDWAFGHFTGSALPMKFVDEEGCVLEIYQQLTQLTDEHFFSFPEINWMEVADYTVDEALDVSKRLLQFSVENNLPMAFCANFHSDPFAYGGRLADIAGRWLEGTLEYAVQNDIPIWSAEEWLKFTQMRHDTVFHSFVWREEDGTLEFGMESGTGNGDLAMELSLMLPSKHGDKRLSHISVDDARVGMGEKTTGNSVYNWIPVPAGSHQIVAQYA